MNQVYVFRIQKQRLIGEFEAEKLYLRTIFGGIKW